MSGARITVDGLRRCLCPSIDAVLLATASSVPHRSRRAGRLPSTTACARPRPATSRRHLHTTSRQLQDDGAANEANPAAGLSDAATAPTSTEVGDRRPVMKVDLESTRAWKGYFDVVLVRGAEERRETKLRMPENLAEDPSPGTIDAEAQKKDPSHMVFNANMRGQQDIPSSSNPIEEHFSSTVASKGAGKDPLDELFGSMEDQQRSLPNIFSDEGNDQFDGALDEGAGKDPFSSLVDVENEWKHTRPDLDDFGPGTPTNVDGTGFEQALFDGVSVLENRHDGESPVPNGSGVSSSIPFEDSGSTTSVPLNPEATETLSADGVQQQSRPQRKGNQEMAERLLQMKPPFTEVPPEAKKEDILQALTLARMRGPRKYRRITATLLERLLSIDPTPKAFYYDLLFRAHCLPEGSADVIAILLQEMRQERVHWSSNAYHSVLRALTIHPDYLLRNVIIREMKERWIDIMPKGHRFIALGLLRDEQYEMALDKLEQMIQQGIEVDPWVFDIFIYVFGKLGFLDDALRLVRHRLDRGFDVSVNIWYFLLDACSKGQNHQATTYIWNRTVQQGLVNPSDGVALNVLNMASVYGDTELATQVIQYLAERGTRLSRPHYEALADAYSMQGNVERAIEVYCIMHGAGAEVNQASAGTLCQSLSRDPSRIDKAVQAMEELRKTYKLPIGILNAVLNEMVKSSTSNPEDAFMKAMQLYRRTREFVPTGPNWETFRNLLWRCTRPDVAQFLAGEMIAFHIRQNLVIIELMFKVHVEHNGPTHRVKAAFYKVAPHFHSDYAPGSRRWQNIMDLSVKLVKRLIAERDPEAWRILDICKRNGLEEDTIWALREEVEGGKLAKIDAPARLDVQNEDSSRLGQI